MLLTVLPLAVLVHLALAIGAGGRVQRSAALLVELALSILARSGIQSVIRGRILAAGVFVEALRIIAGGSAAAGSGAAARGIQLRAVRVLRVRIL